MDASRLNKAIGWSYPTSDNAKWFGFYDTGCWTIEIGIDDDLTPKRAVCAFATFDEAEKHADKIPLPFSHLTQKKRSK